MIKTEEYRSQAYKTFSEDEKWCNANRNKTYKWQLTMKQLHAVLYNNGMVDDLLQVAGKNIDDNLHWFGNRLFSVRLFY